MIVLTWRMPLYYFTATQRKLSPAQKEKIDAMKRDKKMLSDICDALGARTRTEKRLVGEYCYGINTYEIPENHRHL